MRRLLVRAAVVGSLLLGAAGPLLAQQGTSDIGGKVTDEQGAGRVDPARADAAARRRRERVFGDVLPESTTDDRDPDSDRPAGSSSDEWLRANVPPHHA